MAHVIRLFLIAALVLSSSGCMSLGVHRSARPVGKGNLEVGFATGRPTWVGGFTTAGAVGGAEGFMRYGMTRGLDAGLTAGSAGVTGRLDWSFIRSRNLNAALGVGLGVSNAMYINSNSTAMDGVIIVPDLTGLVSIGGEKGEFTVGLRLMAGSGGGAMSNDYFGSQSGGVEQAFVGGGGLMAYTFRGKRLNVTPELDLYAGRYGYDFGLLVMPSLAFSMTR